MNQSYYQQIMFASIAPHVRQMSPITGMSSTGCGLALKGMIISSTVKVKVELFSGNTVIATIFSLPGQTTQVNLNLSTLNGLHFSVQNRDNQAADTYVTLMLEDNWDAFDTHFTQELEKTITT